MSWQVTSGKSEAVRLHWPYPENLGEEPRPSRGNDHQWASGPTSTTPSINQLAIQSGPSRGGSPRARRPAPRRTWATRAAWRGRRARWTGRRRAARRGRARHAGRPAGSTRGRAEGATIRGGGSGVSRWSHCAERESESERPGPENMAAKESAPGSARPARAARARRGRRRCPARRAAPREAEGRGDGEGGLGQKALRSYVIPLECF